MNRFMAGVVLRQALLVLGGYSLVWALRLALRHREIPAWLFVLGFVLFDAGFLSFDLGLNYFFAARVSYPLFGHLRSAALDKVFQMSMEWHQRRSSGTLVGEVNNGVGKVVQTAEGISRELFPAVIQTGFSLIPLTLFSPISMPAAASALAFFLWLTIAENRRRLPYKKARYRDYARDFGVFAESVDAVQPVVQFGQTGRLLRHYDRLQGRIIDAGLEETRLGNSYGWRRSIVLTAAKRICQGIWIWKYREGKMDPAMIMYLNMLMEQLLTSFWGYAGLLERLYDGLEPTKILVDLLEETPAIRDEAAGAVAVPEQVGIRMLNVNFGYTQGNRVMRDFSMSVGEGEIVGIVGRSGCGKTTLHRLVSRMFDIDSGGILIGGKDVREWPLEQLRGLYSHVSQDGGVFFSGSSLLNLIRFGRPEATFYDVVHAAKCACIHEDIIRMPRKYKTRVGRSGVTLSKGQQQRIALAQALLALDTGRKVLVLDEFTSALDSETEGGILENLRPYLAGRTVILIAHRLSTLRRIADRIVVLDEGGIAEEGTHAELLERGGWYAEMVRLQAVGEPALAP
jgi:ABC-type multidrug transport system fused ATPase/permease subunit